MIKKCYFAKCGAKVLVFLQPAKYFLYFCPEFSIYLDELEENSGQSASVGSVVRRCAVVGHRLGDGLAEPQLVFVSMLCPGAGRCGAACMASEAGEPLLTLPPDVV